MPQIVSLITTLITNRALCRDCISAKTLMKPEAIDTAIEVLARTVNIDHYPNGTCAECGLDGMVFAIDRPPHR